MTTQNHHATLRRRKENKRRQADRKATDKPTLVRPAPTRSAARPPATTPLRPVTPITPTPTPIVRPTVVPPPPTVSPVVPPVITTPVTSVLPSVLPTSTIPILPPPSTTVITTRQPSTTRIISTTARSTRLPSTTPSASPSPAAGVSTGAVVGGLIGGFAALGLIGAALFLFLRRAKERKERNDEAFNATKFRHSAVLLDDPSEKHGKPRPPTIIEQHVQSRPQPSSVPSASGTHYPAGQAGYGAPYGEPSNYDSIHPRSYGVQNTYERYPPQTNAYGYGTPHGYLPHLQYPPQSHYGAHQYHTQQFDAYPSPGPLPSQHTSSLEADHDSLNLPNPFATLPSPVSESAPTNHSSNTSSASTTLNPISTPNLPTVEGSDAPPAYEATSKFKDFKADVKAKLGLTAVNTTDGHSGSPTSTSQTSTNAAGSISASSSHLAPTTATGIAIGPRAGDKGLPARPLSGTSTITTVYDLNDAYGGM